MTSLAFAVNYSTAAADLLQEGRIEFDRFKCPAWPDLIAEAQQYRPVYVHFPLNVGQGTGDALDTETGRLADWDKVEALLAQTDTPLVNVHLAPSPQDCADDVSEPLDPARVDQVVDRLIADLGTVVRRFGSDRVIAENPGMQLRSAISPHVISRVVEDTGCGFLLDASHARLAAYRLGMDVRDYVSALPVAHVREIHVTGTQRYEGRWIERSRQAGVDEAAIQRYAGWWMDHMPMTEADWEYLDWIVRQVRGGRWGSPWIVALECGGVGSWFEALADRNTLAEQIPRLWSALRHPS